MKETQTYQIALIGNPNCGKTTVFNALTHSKQRVGNWPGVTVERKTGHYQHANSSYEIVDLPGTYSLDKVDQDTALDEAITREFLQSAQPHLIVNILDAANLERNLYLTIELAELGRPMVVVLNMMDVAKQQRLRIDLAALSSRLGCPVVGISAASGKGIDKLKDQIARSCDQLSAPSLLVAYDAQLQGAIDALTAQLPSEAQSTISARAIALDLLEADQLTERQLGDHGPALAAQAQRLAQDLGTELDLRIADARFSLANDISQTVKTREGELGRDLTDRIDAIALNRLAGIPIFLALMYLMFMFTIKLGGAFIDFFDQAAAAVFVDGLAHGLQSLGTYPWLTTLLAQGLGGGIQIVATFIPIIGFLYLFLSILEDSGYMARAAFVMDRFMRMIGLPGKSFVPLIVGFGCNVPAIMATRTLEHQRDRLLTIAMAPFMSCGARLPVYVLFAAAFFPTQAQNVVFALYLIGIAAAVLTGLVLKGSLLKGEPTPFIMELPRYHLPTLRGILTHTWDRLRGFVIRAGRIIVPMVLVINFLNAWGVDGSFGHEDTEQSVLAEIGRTISPAFSPFGLNEQNWPAAVGIFTGVLAKEVVVGTLNATYQALARQDQQTEDDEPSEAFELGDALAEAFATIPANLVEALGDWADPLGLAVGDLSDSEQVAQDESVSLDTFGVMAERFDGAAGAFAYLLFILLYFPCTAATAAVYQESGTRWMLFVVAWTTGLGYGMATLWYQAARLERDPLTSTVWILAVTLALAGAILAMRRYGAGPKNALAPAHDTAEHAR